MKRFCAEMFEMMSIQTDYERGPSTSSTPCHARYPAIPIVAVCEGLTIWISRRNDLKAFLQGASNQCIRKYGNFISWVSCFYVCNYRPH